MRRRNVLEPISAFSAALRRGWGCDWRSASKAAAWAAWLLRSGTDWRKSPSCGMHSWRQTNQLAFSLISSVPVGELNVGARVSGTPNSVLPSKP
ncbi:MAG: hypothetical protein RLZZ395_1799 [Pseudomonadota bacterium]